MPMRLFFSLLALSLSLQAADVLGLVQMLDRNDTAAFTTAVRTFEDANAMRDDNHKTILMYAAWVGNAEAVRHLIAKGADVNALDSGGVSALHLAVWKEHVPIALYLLENGAATDVLSLDGMTPADMALLKQNQTLIDAFEKAAPKRKSLF